MNTIKNLQIRIFTFFCLILCFGALNPVGAQINKEQLALDIYKADEANTQQLKEFIWKRKSDVSIDGEVKLTTITEFSFDDAGELQATMVDAKSSVKKKPGLRGKAQSNAIEAKAEYVQQALELSMAYTFMTKGQLLDFFDKATITDKDGIITAIAENVYVKGDKLTIVIEAATKLFVKKTFSSLLGSDAISGVLDYEKFSSGVNHGSTTLLEMPAQNMKIVALNQDYSQRIK